MDRFNVCTGTKEERKNSNSENNYDKSLNLQDCVCLTFLFPSFFSLHFAGYLPSKLKSAVARKSVTLRVKETNSEHMKAN